MEQDLRQQLANAERAVATANINRANPRKVRPTLTVGLWLGTVRVITSTAGPSISPLPSSGTLKLPLASTTPLLLGNQEKLQPRIYHKVQFRGRIVEKRNKNFHEHLCF